MLTGIAEKIGEINAAHLQRPRAELRKSNRIKTIHSSLAIEGNTLSIEQVSSLLENKRVLGPKKDIREVKNAIAVYDQLLQFNPFRLSALLSAHRLLLDGLIAGAGKLRSGSAGILKGSGITHVAPPGKMVKPLLKELFAYLKRDRDPLLIKSCVFHYELEFIHPFADGNGRMGRLWQTILLMRQYPVFEYLPVESLIKKRQGEYYTALSQSDKEGNSTPFIVFMLGVLAETLESLLAVQTGSLTGADRINLFQSTHTGGNFTRQDYLRRFKEISAATASRDLKDAVAKKILAKKGDKRMTTYRFLNRK